MIGVSFSEISVIVVVAAIFMKPADISQFITKSLMCIERLKGGIAGKVEEFCGDFKLDFYDQEIAKIAQTGYQDKILQDLLESEDRRYSSMIIDEYLAGEGETCSAQPKIEKSKHAKQAGGISENYELFPEFSFVVEDFQVQDITKLDTAVLRVEKIADIRSEIEQKYLVLKRKIRKYGT